METKKTNELKKEEVKPTVKFVDCENVGEEIDALVSYFAGSVLGSYTLQMAYERTKAIDEKLKAHKKKLIQEDKEAN